MAAFDHGVLNVPLAKRGKSIDGQIDAWKRDEAAKAAADRRAAASQIADERKTAKALFQAAPKARLDQLAERCGCTTAAIKAKLKSDAHWQPAFVIKLLS